MVCTVALKKKEGRKRRGRNDLAIFCFSIPIEEKGKKRSSESKEISLWGKSEEKERGES